MIPRAFITEWRSVAPWSSDAQVEQDLVISRALLEIYSDPFLASELAFRGGTALHKLFLRPPSRYSEDIDLVRRSPGPIGPVVDALRSRLDPWLGRPQRKRGPGGVALFYRFESELAPVTPLRLKIEINTREHFTVLGFLSRAFAVESRWFAGSAEVVTYRPEEMLGTKLRALHQRKKGRDLFDLALALERIPSLDPPTVVRCFEEYVKRDGGRVTRAEFERNLSLKAQDREFMSDLGPLLADSGRGYDSLAALKAVRERLVRLLPAEPWKGEPSQSLH